jgi:uncharacterized membrane protein YfcA
LNVWLVCAAIGAVTGIVAALCGVGGGIVMVPAFVYWLKLPQKTAVATSLAAIILTSLAASARNSANALVDWRIAAATGLSGAVLAWFAADWLRTLSNATLTRIFAVLLIVVGVRMLFPR